MTHVCDSCGGRIDHANNGHAKACRRACPEPLPPITEPPQNAPETPRRTGDGSPDRVPS